MKKTLLTLIAILTISQSYADGIKIEKNIQPIGTGYHNRIVLIDTSTSYDPVKRILFIWTNKGECDVTVSIYKDDEEVAYETIFVEPGEEISCDFSDCDAGEYTIYTTVDGEMELIDTITVN